MLKKAQINIIGQVCLKLAQYNPFSMVNAEFGEIHFLYRKPNGKNLAQIMKIH